MAQSEVVQAFRQQLERDLAAAAADQGQPKIHRFMRKSSSSESHSSSSSPNSSSSSLSSSSSRPSSPSSSSSSPNGPKNIHLMNKTIHLNASEKVRWRIKHHSVEEREIHGASTSASASASNQAVEKNDEINEVRKALENIHFTLKQTPLKQENRQTSMYVETAHLLQYRGKKHEECPSAEKLTEKLGQTVLEVRKAKSEKRECLAIIAMQTTRAARTVLKANFACIKPYTQADENVKKAIDPATMTPPQTLKTTAAERFVRRHLGIRKPRGAPAETGNKG